MSTTKRRVEKLEAQRGGAAKWSRATLVYAPTTEEAHRALEEAIADDRHKPGCPAVRRTC